MASFIPPTLASETIFSIGTFEVRNTLITDVFTLVLLVVVGLLVKRKNYQLVPHGIQNFVEVLVGGLFDFFNSIVGDEDKTKKFFPIVATIFFYVIISNWMGLLPGFGSIGIFEEHEGAMTLVPFFRSNYADVNMTFAIALISVTACQVFGFSMLGFKHYAGKFFINPLKNPVGSFVGLLELMSEFSKMISFSFRLFGNVFAGEVLLLVITFLVPFIAPLPFYGLELFVGFIQALVFSFLTLIFLQIATTEHH
ncbi:F0F1 ATP synthase subunit A [Candidatus Peregrinibacteria bacterium]|nr:F0F1 ATP synthase subunit A [Candidatus Peregrinibacteria bacterium]